MLKFFKKPAVLLLLAVVLAVGFFAFRSFGNKKGPEIRTVEVQKTDLSQEVSVTGKVKPVEEAKLAFEQSGKVSAVVASVGASVQAGDVLALLNASEAEANYAKAQANVAAEEAALAELKAGASVEDIRVAETAVLNAQRDLADAKADAALVETKAKSDVNEDYENTFAELMKAVSVGEQALFMLTDIQYAYFNDNNSESLKLADNKAFAVAAFFGDNQNAGRLTNEAMADLSGGARTEALNLRSGSLDAQTENAADAMRIALGFIKTALESVKIDSLSSADKTSLNTEKLNVSNELVTLSSKIQAIVSQKAANADAMQSASASVNEAENALRSAEDELAVKQSPARSEKIAAQQARTFQARAEAESVFLQIAKHALRAPFSGIVTRQDAKVGEIVSSNVTVAAVISASQFEMEAFVPEADIANVKIEDRARVTLDAYGEDVSFPAAVASIDPAETVLDGVATYKITLRFLLEDPRIKSGMTANIDIVTDKKSNVLAVPLRSVLTRNGEKYVRVLRGEAILEISVALGMKASDGNIEIVSGLQAGDRVITFIAE